MTWLRAAILCLGLSVGVADAASAQVDWQFHGEWRAFGLEDHYTKVGAGGVDVALPMGVFFGGELALRTDRDEEGSYRRRHFWVLTSATAGFQYPRRSERGFQPYGALTFGRQTGGSSTFNVLTYGGGVRYWINDHFAPFVDARKMKLFHYDIDVQINQFTVGLTFRP